MTHRVILCAALLGASSIASSALAQETLVRADLPLWTEVGEGVWPRQVSFDGGAGCASRLKDGVWKWDVTGTDDDQWVLIENRGVYHCHLGFVVALEIPASWPEGDIALLIELEDLDGSADGRDLYALQQGFLGGSTYVLLAAKRGRGMLDRFDVLDPECPDEWMRESTAPSVYTTEYCAVPSQEGLRRLAREAARKPPVATLIFDRPATDSPD